MTEFIDSIFTVLLYFLGVVIKIFIIYIIFKLIVYRINENREKENRKK